MAFDTSVLDVALAHRRVNAERERQALLTKVLHLLDKLALHYSINEAYVFGSLTIPGRFGPNSDVDVAVEQINETQFFEAMSKFSTELGYDVDLVELDKCHFADKIRREGIKWMQSV